MGGASNGGFVANFLLQVSGILLAFYALVRMSSSFESPTDRWFRVLAIGLCVVVGLQFVPLPLSLWESLPGRGAIASELALVGVIPEATFITLSVYDSLASAAWLLPACCLALALALQEEIPAVPMAMVLVGCTFLAIALGLAQFLGGRESAAYLYEITNRGLMVGFFANANHMATLLLITMPFLTAALQALRTTRVNLGRELLLLWVVAIGFLFLGVILVGSLTGYALAVPVLVLCGMIMFPSARRWLAIILLLPGLALGAGVVASTEEGGNVFAEETVISDRGRQQIFATTFEAARDYWPVGTGLGTFRDIYDNYEERDGVENVYINHAHNDYLEVLLELGLPGLLGVLAFLVWWFDRLRRIVVDRIEDPFVHAAAIASGTILLHSGWDYPLRTAALSALFAFCCIILARAGAVAGASMKARRPGGRLV